MKRFKFMKVGVILSLLLFLCTNSFASKYILNDDGLVDDRAKEKIQLIGDEVKEKMDVEIYLYIKADLGLDEKIKTKDKIEFIRNFETDIIKDLKDNYVLLTMAVEDTHVNLLFSESLKKVINKNDILDGYVVPLLASKDKNTLFSKVSAASLNGYSAIADSLSKDNDVELESNIGNEGKVASTILRVAIYFLVVTGLLAYTYAILKNRKRK